MIALLTIMAVAFLASSSLDQTTARAFANDANAQLAAKTAVTTAIARFVDNLSTYTDSATTWELVNQSGGTLEYQGTTLYYREQSPQATGIPSPLHALPLISGAQSVLIPNPPQTLAQREATLQGAFAATAFDDTNSFDLNHARFLNDTQGWIGAPTGASARPQFRGQWVNQTNSDGKVTSRYAYWMEDESFKANANLMGKTARGSGTLGDSPSQIPIQGVLTSLFPSRTDYDQIAADVFDARSLFTSSAFYGYRQINNVTAQTSTYDFSKLADDAKFEATIFSGTSNLSRSESKRVNLNKVVVGSTVASAIRTQLDEIIKTVSYHLPNFGQRFYRSGSNLNSTTDVPATDQTIYLNKVAANIRDYIDTDSQPTIVNNDSPTYSIRIGSAPTNCIQVVGGGTLGTNEVVAIGKEHVPSVQEYALRVRQITLSPRIGTQAAYKITIDHYVEFWNTSNRDILLTELGSNPFLLIANQPGWNAGTLNNIAAGATRDIKLFLNIATKASDHTTLLTSFPAGSVTVISTDPATLATLTPDLTRVYYIPITPDTGGTAGLRTYSGNTNLKSGSQLRLNLKTRTTISSDYETELVLGNDLGILESAWGAAALTSLMSINADLGTDNRFDTTKWHFQGASIKGNRSALTPNATTGDPRTNAEQLKFDLNSGTASNDKTRYFDSGLDSAHIPGSSTLGAANSIFVNPGTVVSTPPFWPDYSSSNQAAADAPAVIANASLTSIGQLGDIFDPVRVKGDSADITLSRSGGRTLKVGQADRLDATANAVGLWDGNSSSASREWTAWRLADIFTTTDSVQLDGRININGISRDGGTALKAALYGYSFQSSPDSDPNFAGKGFDTDPNDTSDKVNELVKQAQARLKNDPTTTVYSGQFGTSAGPFAERGELSELPLFNVGSDLVSTVDTAKVYDRGREELFRRLAELITTRGNIFTIYAAGQSLIPPQPGGTMPIVAATSQLKITFRIDPVWNAGPPADPFDPSLTARFNKPDRYAVTILYAGD